MGQITGFRCASDGRALGKGKSVNDGLGRGDLVCVSQKEHFTAYSESAKYRF